MSFTPAPSGGRGVFKPEHALVLLRVAVAILLGIHGAFRALAGGVSGFGTYLSSRGFPLGFELAWCITAFELVGPVLLLAGRFVRVIAAGHIVILLAGIVLVHAREGWFVVGGGRNGVEYSVLLVVSLVCIFLGSSHNSRAGA